MKMILATVSCILMLLGLASSSPLPSREFKPLGGIFLHGIGLEKIFGKLYGVGGNGGEGYRKEPTTLKQFLTWPLFPLPDYFYKYQEALYHLDLQEHLKGEEGHGSAEGGHGEEGHGGAEGGHGEEGHGGAEGGHGEEGHGGAEGGHGEEGHGGAEGGHGEEGHGAAEGGHGEEGHETAEGGHDCEEHGGSHGSNEEEHSAHGEQKVQIAVLPDRRRPGKRKIYYIRNPVVSEHGGSGEEHEKPHGK
ncbi:PE-PGRS family protein PE_PGRS16-like isoform X1 [Palaemon carinicauda]|uniref:PE-PGRS family protein PE_PGRS16-like isoform X1 n=1 Tax=Palaemon carinicauda TaxID=392227 RepID=UPI0035B5A5B3